MFVAAGVPDVPQQHQAFRTTYRRHLERRLAEPGTGRALPGVLKLLDQLPTQRGVLLGLLTGNFEETGSMKLRACGIDPTRFSVCVWGDESGGPPTRPRTPCSDRDGQGGGHKRGRPLNPAEVTIIGDTPHDVQCARAHGCRSLGVATGHFSIENLQEAGADLALPNLAETDKVLTWLMNGAASSAAGEKLGKPGQLSLNMKSR